MGLSSIQLEAFLETARTLHFSKAAENLHITQSALSQRIQKLEEELGTTLFIRDRAGLKLTPVALELVRYCQIKEGLESEFLHQVKGAASQNVAGSIRIGGISSVMRSVILKSLGPLLHDHSQVQLQMMIKESFELPDMLRRSEIDYMILSEKLEREELSRVLLGAEKYVLVEKRGYQGRDLYLDHDEKDPTTFQYLKLAKFKAQNIQRRYLDDVYGLIDGVKLGLGRAVLPLHLIQSEKSLEILNPKIQLEIPVYLYFYAQPFYPRLHHQIVETIEKNAVDYLK